MKTRKFKRETWSGRKKARRMKTNPNDSFLNSLNIGDSDSSGRQIRGFDSPDDIYDWFKSDRSDDWRQRD